ncbi:MAG: glycosyltransferase [Acidobacteriota bacterium]
MGSPRRFLFLTQTYPRFDGDTSGPFIRDLARGLVRRGDGVTVLTPHAPEVEASWDDDGVEVQSFRYAPESFELVGYSRSLQADETMKRGAMLSAPLYAGGAWRATAAELKRADGEGRPYDLVQGHWVVPNGLVVARLAGKVPLAVGLHGSDVFMAEKPWLRPVVASALKRIDVMTGCSPELVDRVCAVGFDRERARVIPYGVDGGIFFPDVARGEDWRRRLGIPNSAPMVLSVGRMATKKGYQVLMEGLEALMTRHATCHVVLAGAGDRLDEFRRAAEPWASRVHFPGSVLRDTLPDLYRAADLFTLPAVHDPKGNVDGLPNVILEGMASGLPIVASEISGIPLAVEDGVHGRLVPEQDPGALVDALVELLEDPRRCRAMGEAGRRRALEELSWDAVAGRYRAAYDLALGAASARA